MSPAESFVPSPSRRFYLLVAVALLVLFAAELSLSVKQLTQTADEAAHLYSGYQYWKARDYGLNPEHPPLLKLVAALPLLPMSLRLPHPPTFMSKIEEYVGGAQLLYSNDADTLLWRARMAASIFSLLLASLILTAGWQMFSPRAAIFALVLCVFEPNLLAHGALITTDMVAAFTSLACVYALYRYIKHPGTLNMVVAGLTLGLAFSAKFSALIMLPILAMLMLAEAMLAPRWQSIKDPPAESAALPNRGRRLLNLCGALVTILAIAMAVLWAFYTFRYQARPGGAVMAPTLAAYTQQLIKPWERSVILALAHWHILPESYLYGLTDVEVFSIGRPSFLLGTLYPGPVRLYFPIAFVIKGTLPFLLLLISLPFLLWRSRQRPSRELLFLLIPPAVFFLVSLNAPLNIGIRHILPVYPFLILLAGFAASLLAERSRTGAAVIAVLLACHAVSSARTFPDYLAYSNEAFGGKAKTYRLLSDSNTDWGQGIKEVRSYLRENNIKDCWFAPFMGEAQYYNVPCKALPTGFDMVRGMQVALVPATVTGTLLVGASEVSGLFWGPPAFNPYSRFQTLHPDDVIGGSVLVFHGSFDIALAAALAHVSQANALIRQQKMPEALREARAAVALAPGSPAAQSTLGTVLASMGKKSEAEQAFQLAGEKARIENPGDIMRLNEYFASLAHRQ